MNEHVKANPNFFLQTNRLSNFNEPWIPSNKFKPESANFIKKKTNLILRKTHKKYKFWSLFCAVTSASIFRMKAKNEAWLWWFLDALNWIEWKTLNILPFLVLLKRICATRSTWEIIGMVLLLRNLTVESSNPHCDVFHLYDIFIFMIFFYLFFFNFKNDSRFEFHY
jgi:hypothetical protein